MKVAILIDDPIAQALKQTISLFGEVEFVADPYLAHVVIAENAKKLIPYYCAEREFIIMAMQGNLRGDQEAKNVHEYSVLDAIRIMTFPAARAAKGHLSDTLPGPAEVVAKRIENAGAKRVLVVDDTVKHQKSASVLLSDCDLTIATGYTDAMKLLASEKFDMVLTDMEMPMADALATHILGKKVPYGLLIATEAARVGVKQVAVVTDLNHHADPFSAAFDHFAQHDFVINGATVKYMHAPMTNIDGESVKDWKSAMEKFNK